MKITADYHTHTTYSHGKGSIEDNVLAAIKRGLKRIAISDHGSGSMLWGLRGQAARDMRREIDQMNDKYGDQIEVLMGVECNLTGDGKCDYPKERGLFDLVLMGYHRGAFPRDLAGWRSFFNSLSEKRRCEKATALAMLHALEKYDICAVTHPGEYLATDIPTLAEGCAKLGVALELNNKHPTMNEAEVKTAAGLGASFIISSDAHYPDRVGLFDGAIELAVSAGVQELIANAEGVSRNLRFAF